MYMDLLFVIRWIGGYDFPEICQIFLSNWTNIWATPESALKVSKLNGQQEGNKVRGEGGKKNEERRERERER